MRETATTVREVGFDPGMSAATADKQAWIAALARSGWFHDLAAHLAWHDYADKIIAVAEDRQRIAPKRSGGTS